MNDFTSNVSQKKKEVLQVFKRALLLSIFIATASNESKIGAEDIFLR
ncbi:MAG: hypothetical protein HFJ38_04780 [Bacilli bacterium]|nr:hypothetical protein [Bacilli bacterium]